VSDSPYKEFRKDGWPLCPRCGEDELYSFLMLGWTKPEPPSIEECMATGMRCYRCSWEHTPKTVPQNVWRLYPNCWRCSQPFDLSPGEPQFIYCPSCREAIRDEREREWAGMFRDEVAEMGWPEVVGDMDLVPHQPHERRSEG